MENGSGVIESEVLDRRVKLGRAMRAARLPESQERLAERIGCPQSSISMWETGKIAVATEQVLRIERALNLPVGALLIEAGFVDPDQCPGVAGQGEGRNGLPWRPPAGTPDGFPHHVAAWVEEFEPLVSAMVLFHRSGIDDRLLRSLRECRPVVHLRLSWDRWECLEESAGRVPGDAITSVVGSGVFQACREGIWGEVVPAKVGLHQIWPPVSG